MYVSPILTDLMDTLRDHADATGEVQIGQAQLAKVLGCTPNIVSSALAILRAEGTVVSRPPTPDEIRAQVPNGRGGNVAHYHRVWLSPQERRQRFAAVDGGDAS